MKQALQILLLMIFISVSCSAPKTQEDAFSAYEAAKKDQVLKLPLNSIIKDICVIELDKEPLLGIVHNIHETEDSYYIHADDILYQYDKNGMFIRQIGAVGRGPGEYISIRDMTFIEDKLYVLDYISQSILCYDKEGKFIKIRKSELMESNTILTSFFQNEGNIMLCSPVNASMQEIYKYDLKNENISAVSKRDREMLIGEVLMGGVLTFGDRTNPYVYNSFNDTVYVVNNDKLVPSFLIKQDKYRYDFDELTMERFMSISDTKINIRWISAAGSHILISYRIRTGEDEENYLGLYNTKTKEYSQTVEFTENTNDYTKIDPTEKLFEGLNPNELISIKSISDTDDSYAIIKYKF